MRIKEESPTAFLLLFLWNYAIIQANTEGGKRGRALWTIKKWPAV